VKGNFRIIRSTRDTSFVSTISTASYGKKIWCISNNDQKREIQDIEKQKNVHKTEQTL
jgi:hypothetical protein